MVSDSAGGVVAPATGRTRRDDIERVINSVLRISLSEDGLDDVLQYALEEILSVDWLTFGSQGSILLSDGSEELSMRAHRGLPADTVATCSRVPIGTCLCGEAAETLEMVVRDCRCDRHSTEADLRPHGHCVMPITCGGRLFGVLNLYTPPDFTPSESELNFLSAITDTLTGIIQRAQVRAELSESESRMGAIVQAFDGLLYMCTADYEIEFLNERFAQLIGRDATGEQCYTAIHGLDVPCGWCSNERVFAGETVRWEVTLDLDGRHYMVVNRAIAHADGTQSKVSMSTDITERRRAEEQLELVVKDLESALDGVVRSLASTTDQRDPYTAIHQERVARLAVAIAEWLGLTDDIVEGVRTAALLHDIGKIAVPSEILSKPGTLSDMEMGIVRSHPSISHLLLEHVPFKRPVAEAVLQHHEHLDGTGYPGGLHKEEIIMEAKILTVADVVEAMASHRPYRPALGVEAALAEVREHAGSRYDVDVVDACEHILHEGAFEL